MSDFVWEEFVSYLSVYDAYNENGLIDLVRIGKDYDGGYVVPEVALSSSDSLFGYGIRDDISFEESYSNIYNKKSYGFDCTVKNVIIGNPLTYFIPECIGNLNHVEDFGENRVEKQEQIVTSFVSQVQKLNLEKKNLFIKMDIEGAEYDALPGIIAESKYITGVALEIHFYQDNQINPAMNLLKLLNKDFLLVHLHGCNCADKTFTSNKVIGEIPRVIELSYINKNLVSTYNLLSEKSFPNEKDFPICPTSKESSFTIIA